MNIRMPLALMKYRDPERCWYPEFYELYKTDVEKTGIDLYRNLQIESDVIAVHPQLTVGRYFRELPAADALIHFHDHSYTNVYISRNSIQVVFSVRASEKTIEDVTKIINEHMEVWSHRRADFEQQQYIIEWKKDRYDVSTRYLSESECS
ncbi:hypothetical protein VPHD479_0290 [Vibrio phage D479]